MKTHSHSVVSKIILSTLLGAALLVWVVPDGRAQTTSADIAAQELQLKQKQLELEKMKLEQEQNKDMQLKITELELEIKKLELEKARRDLHVQETSRQLSMLVQGNVLFDTDKAVIKDGAIPTLDQVALLLREFPEGEVVVTGYADSVGDSDYNQDLSQKRAEAVKTFLVNRAGVSSVRVITRALGEENPVASNMSAEGRQLNRRVEITVTKPVQG